MKQAYTVLVGGDLLFCRRIAQALKTRGIIILGHATQADLLAKMAAQTLPDAVVIHESLGESVDIATRRIRLARRKVAIVALVPGGEGRGLPAILQAGATAIVLDTIGDQQLVDVIRTACAGELIMDPAFGTQLLESVGLPLDYETSRSTHNLTRREIEVLGAVARGMRNRDIAIELGLGRRTVRGYLESVFSKLGVNSRVQAMLIALNQGWVSLDNTSADSHLHISADREKAAIASSIACLAGESPLGLQVDGLCSPKECLGSVVDYHHFAALLDDITAACCLVQDEKYVFANRTMADLLMYPRHELIGLPISQIVLPELRQPVIRLHRMRLAGRPAPSEYDLPLLRRDHTQLTGRFSVKVVSFGGRPGVAVVIREPGRRTMGEGKLRQWLRRFAL